MTIDAKGKVYRAALIGCGSMGSYYMDELKGGTGRMILPLGHAEVLKTCPRTHLVAGADPHEGRLKDFGQRWEVDQLFADHREMLERVQPEIVSIASPPDLHTEHIIDCAERGVKGIFCEKPLSPTLREADALLRACKENGTKLTINHTLRGDPWTHRVRELIEDGVIGDVLTITHTWPGRLFLTGTHRFDLVSYFLGDVRTEWIIGHAEETTDTMTAGPTQRGVDAGGTAYAVYSNGVRVFFNGRDGHPIDRSDISGTKGIIMLDRIDAQLWKKSESGRRGGLLKYPFPQMMRYTAPMVFFVEDLIEAMETGREPMSSSRTARNALEQILATHYSSQHDNCKVYFPFEDLDMRPPFQWFGEGGKALYRAVSPEAQD